PGAEKAEGEAVEDGEEASGDVTRAAAAERDVEMADVVVGPRERKEEKPRVFGGLDLYDPDAEA
ncbi:MAG: hypothetical protein LQ347_004928, partial [Umbilicaria vellea]